MLLRTRALAHMIKMTNFDSQEVTSIAYILKTIVEFESPRVLIQEVSSQQQTSGTQGMHQVTEYFSRAVTLFKDDLSFMAEFTKLLQTALPIGLRHDLVLLYTDELEDANLVKQDTS